LERTARNIFWPKPTSRYRQPGKKNFAEPFSLRGALRSAATYAQRAGPLRGKNPEKN